MQPIHISLDYGLHVCRDGARVTRGKGRGFDYLDIVLTMVSTSVGVGQLSDPAVNIRLMGSKSRESERDR